MELSFCPRSEENELKETFDQLLRGEESKFRHSGLRPVRRPDYANLNVQEGKVRTQVKCVYYEVREIHKA